MVSVAGIGTYHHGDFDAADLAARRGDTTISVCLPARNEANTIGPIVDVLVGELQGGVGLVDEVVVVDDHSTDGTAKIAADAGATVVAAEDVLPDHGDGHGKGEALWKSLYASTGDLVVWCDADVTSFSAGYVVGMVGVLLTHPEVQFVRALPPSSMESSERQDAVSHLVVRPSLSVLFPELTPLADTLHFACAGRRSALEELSLVDGDATLLGIALDLVSSSGPASLALVLTEEDLLPRVATTAPNLRALDALFVVLSRAYPDLVHNPALLSRPGLDPIEVRLTELSPVADVRTPR